MKLHSRAIKSSMILKGSFYLEVFKDCRDCSDQNDSDHGTSVPAVPAVPAVLAVLAVLMDTLTRNKTIRDPYNMTPGNAKLYHIL